MTSSLRAKRGNPANERLRVRNLIAAAGACAGLPRLRLAMTVVSFKKRTKIIIALLPMLTVSIFPLPSVAKDYHCPDQVTTKSTLGGLPKPWREAPPFDKRADAIPVAPKGVMLFSGNPSEGASLIPDNEDAEDANRRSVWTFPSNPSDTEVPWIACYYHDTPIAAALRLPKETKKCEVTLRKPEKYSDIERIVCE